MRSPFRFTARNVVVTVVMNGDIFVARRTLRAVCVAGGGPVSVRLSVCHARLLHQMTEPCRKVVNILHATLGFALSLRPNHVDLANELQRNYKRLSANDY